VPTLSLEAARSPPSWGNRVHIAVWRGFPWGGTRRRSTLRRHSLEVAAGIGEGGMDPAFPPRPTATDTSGRPQDSHRVALSAALEGTTSHESELELWEKGDFTRIAASMGENGEAVVAGLGITPGLKVLDGPGPLMRRRDDGPAGGQTGRRRPRCRYREKSCRSREHSP
jgi:hypothetical protein